MDRIKNGKTVKIDDSGNTENTENTGTKHQSIDEKVA